jgi:hypothetical protein
MLQTPVRGGSLRASSSAYSFQATYRTDPSPGLAGAWLIQRFADQMGCLGGEIRRATLSGCEGGLDDRFRI